jgi:hypothetical protein
MESENRRTSKLVQHAQTRRQDIFQKAWALDSLRTTCRREVGGRGKMDFRLRRHEWTVRRSQEKQ